jgi:hypothetical protein
MAWTAGSVVVLVVNVLLKLVLDVGGVTAGGTKAALSSSILLSLEVTLLGEAGVVWLRAGPCHLRTPRGTSTVGLCSNPIGPSPGHRSGERDRRGQLPCSSATVAAPGWRPIRHCRAMGW